MPDTFVINLDRMPERMTQFRDCNPHLSHVTRFEASDGHLLKPEELVRQKLFEEPIFYSAGAMGAMHSHAHLWDLAATQNIVITVFEDDAIVHEQFEVLAPRLLNSVTDWDIVLWGWNFDEAVSFDLFPGVPSMTRCSQEDMRHLASAIQHGPIQPVLRRLYYGFGLVGYSLSPAGARRLLDRAFPSRPFLYRVPLFGLEVENTGIDSVMSVLYSELNAFVCVPPLVVTRNDHANSTTHDANADVINRVRRKFGMSTGTKSPNCGFRPEASTNYLGSRKFTRNYLNYVDRKGDFFGVVIEFIQYSLMRFHWYENLRQRRYGRISNSIGDPIKIEHMHYGSNKKLIKHGP